LVLGFDVRLAPLGFARRRATIVPCALSRAPMIAASVPADISASTVGASSGKWCLAIMASSSHDAPAASMASMTVAEIVWTGASAIVRPP
jgi:hypothetical protein